MSETLAQYKVKEDTLKENAVEYVTDQLVECTESLKEFDFQNHPIDIQRLKSILQRIKGTCIVLECLSNILEKSQELQEKIAKNRT